MEQLNEDELERERLEKEKQEREFLERQRIERQKDENKLFPNNMLFVIPSWGDLLGYPTLGQYANHNVMKIETDIVLFFSGYDYSIETLNGSLHFLFGLGFHYLKFELESGKYITDHRILTGLVLSDFVYDHMASSASITLDEDRDIVIAEKVIRVPINLSDKPENHLTFIKGALMRNFFIPNKDLFLEFINHIRDASTYQIYEYGHMLLSTHWDSFNSILVSEKMRINPYKSYMNSAAGLNGIYYGAEQLLQETISPINLQIIEQNITQLKEIYSNLEFDPMYVFSIVENASKYFSPEDSKIPTTPGTTPKQSLFASAADRMDAFVSWPIQFPRKAVEIPQPLPKVIEPSEYLQKANNKGSINAIPQKTNYEREHFELDVLKSEKIEFKPLPSPPAANIKEIMNYLKKVVVENYEMRSIGSAFEIARDKMRQISIGSISELQKDIWEMSKYANIYSKKEQNMGLPIKDQKELLEKINEWLFEIQEEERKERERIEKERLEKERKERERIERLRQEKERQMLEQKRQEKEKLERERKAQIEMQKQEKIRLEQEKKMKEQETERALEKEKRELEKLKRERKLKEKLAKQKAKKEKKLQKQRKKVEKKKQKEQEKLQKL
ncbi:MAG: hypothetical protein ACFFBP_05945 [Promethearchaeota archaeon]